MKWSHAPGIGLRGSIGGAAVPRAERIRTADPETDEPFESPMSGRSLRWINDGQPGALCPVAIRAWHASNVDDMMDLECRGGGAAGLCSPVANGAAAWGDEDLPVTPHAFIMKWRASTVKERSASQKHFIDLCRLLGEPPPFEADPSGEAYCFERGARKLTAAALGTS